MNNKIKTVYFLGIGGIGMSALARFFKKQGADVHGYDRTATPLTAQLEKEGMFIHYNENMNCIWVF
jgi:UDP-N-acetylmuramate--alanine ligase